MSKIFFTSDLHLGHANIVKYDKRPFDNVNEHDMFLIDEWNSTVNKGDRVYILGDFCWKNQQYAARILQGLNGLKLLIRGNHDQAIRGAAAKLVTDLGSYHELYVQDTSARGNKQLIVLMHYPLLSWNKKHYGTWHLHGHVHGKLDNRNVGVCRHDVCIATNDYKLLEYQQVKDIMLSKVLEPEWHHQPEEVDEDPTGLCE